MVPEPVDERVLVFPLQIFKLTDGVVLEGGAGVAHSLNLSKKEMNDIQALFLIVGVLKAY